MGGGGCFDKDHGDVTMCVTELYNEAKYLDTPVELHSFIRYMSNQLPDNIQQEIRIKKHTHCCRVKRDVREVAEYEGGG